MSKAPKVVHQGELIKVFDNGITHYEGRLNDFTWEEIEQLNKEHYENEASFIDEILEDGYIEFPTAVPYGKEILWGSSYLPPDFMPACSEGFFEKFGHHFNIYIPSYGRADTATTGKLLSSFGIENWFYCVDPSQYPEYKKHVDSSHIIVRDPTVKSDKKLDTCSGVICPDTMRGAIGGFNSLLFLSKSLGESHYWTMDDDIFNMRLKSYKGNEINNGPYNKDDYYRCSSLTKEIGFDMLAFLLDLEEAMLKMRNVSFLSTDKAGIVFTYPITWKAGTRSYTFYLTNNSIFNGSMKPGRIGRQNSDIITSLEMSRRGFTNLIFNGFHYDTPQTQGVGGETNLYKKLGTLDKGEVLIQAEPNFAKISHVYNRIHHTANFSNYAKMRVLGAERR